MPIVYKGVVNDSERNGSYTFAHWRTKGSKNGVRIWQNEDGSYTEAGRNFKPGGRYNQSDSDGDSGVSKAEAKTAAQRAKNAEYNERVAKTIPYSRDDLSDYEKQQELSVMTAQLKYADAMREYQKKAEETNASKMKDALKKELTSQEAKLILGVGVAALAVGGVYLAGGQLDDNALNCIVKFIDPTGAVKLGEAISKDGTATEAAEAVAEGDVDAEDLGEIEGQVSMDELAKETAAETAAAVDEDPTIRGIKLGADNAKEAINDAEEAREAAKEASDAAKTSEDDGVERYTPDDDDIVERQDSYGDSAYKDRLVDARKADERNIRSTVDERFTTVDGKNRDQSEGYARVNEGTGYEKVDATQRRNTVLDSATQRQKAASDARVDEWAKDAIDTDWSQSRGTFRQQAANQASVNKYGSETPSKSRDIYAEADFARRVTNMTAQNALDPNMTAEQAGDARDYAYANKAAYLDRQAPGYAERLADNLAYREEQTASKPKTTIDSTATVRDAEPAASTEGAKTATSTRTTTTRSTTGNDDLDSYINEMLGKNQATLDEILRKQRGG